MTCQPVFLIVTSTTRDPLNKFRTPSAALIAICDSAVFAINNGAIQH